MHTKYVLMIMDIDIQYTRLQQCVIVHTQWYASVICRNVCHCTHTMVCKRYM